MGVPPQEPPFVRGPFAATEQATWLIPDRRRRDGASQLRDSAGVAPASLTSVAPGPEPGHQASYLTPRADTPDGVRQTRDN